MMTIIRAVAEVLILVYLIYLSIHDVRHKQVTNKSLCRLAPLAFLRIMPDLLTCSWERLLSLALGGVFAFGLMLITSVITHQGIGGGDIKLAGILGCLCGLDGIMVLLLTASVSAVIYALIRDLITKDKTKRIAFVPFMTAGYVFSSVVSSIL